MIRIALPPTVASVLLALAPILPGSAPPGSASPEASGTLAAQEYDLLIRDGTVLDGTGNPSFRADVAVRGDRIAAVGRLDGATARRVVDARGLHVIPGFIDLHSHADRDLVADSAAPRRAHNLVAQGITTVVVAPDGRNARWPVRDEMAAYRELGVAMNVVPMVGHNTVRGRVMGDDYERAATDDEIREMARLVREGMEDGAWGLGAGPEYRPGRFGTTGEIVALARVVADYDGFYYSHQRSQSPLPRWQVPSMVDAMPLTGTDGMKETIRIGRETGIRVVGTHIKTKGMDTWGHAAEDVIRIDRAREEGVQVYLDQYPYETFGGGPVEIFPPWAFAEPGTDYSGGLDDPKWRDEERFRNHAANLRANLSDPDFGPLLRRDTRYLLRLKGGAERQIVVHAPGREELVGRTLAEVAAERGEDPLETLTRLAVTGGTPELPSGVLFRPLAAHRFDVVTYMRQRYTATSTDGGVTFRTRPGQHPRYYGAFPRKIAKWVKDEGVISLPFAVRAGTGLPARIVGLPDRGYVREGYRADLVLFDYDRIRDRATITEPDRYPAGIDYVVVNGELTVDGGRRTGALPGRVLDRNELRPRSRVEAGGGPGADDP